MDEKMNRKQNMAKRVKGNGVKGSKSMEGMTE